MDELRTRIRALLSKEELYAEALSDNDDLFDCMGIDGDDAFDLMDRFAAEFGVDMAEHRWFFHHGEEGFGLGMFVSPPPNLRVQRLPITIDLLAEAAALKRWPMVYPAYRLPTRRWDMLV